MRGTSHCKLAAGDVWSNGGLANAGTRSRLSRREGPVTLTEFLSAALMKTLVSSGLDWPKS